MENRCLMQSAYVINMTRQKIFLSQESFAKELSVAASTINRWKKNKIKPNLNAMKKFKEFFEKYNLPYEELEHNWFEHSKE